jgi:hypothetical protein
MLAVLCSICLNLSPVHAAMRAGLMHRYISVDGFTFHTGMLVPPHMLRLVFRQGGAHPQGQG